MPLRRHAEERLVLNVSEESVFLAHPSWLIAPLSVGLLMNRIVWRLLKDTHAWLWTWWNYLAIKHRQKCFAGCLVPKVAKGNEHNKPFFLQLLSTLYLCQVEGKDWRVNYVSIGTSVKDRVKKSCLKEFHVTYKWPNREREYLKHSFLFCSERGQA